MNAVIPPKKSRKEPREYDKRLYKIRHLVEKCVATSSTLVWYCDTLCKKTPVHLLPLSRLGVRCFGLEFYDDIYLVDMLSEEANYSLFRFTDAAFDTAWQSVRKKIKAG